MTSASPMGIYDYDRSRARQQPFAWGADPPFQNPVVTGASSSAAAPGVMQTEVKFVTRVS
jgi:hypothetical protein